MSSLVKGILCELTVLNLKTPREALPNKKTFKAANNSNKACLQLACLSGHTMSATQARVIPRN